MHFEAALMQPVLWLMVRYGGLRRRLLLLIRISLLVGRVRLRLHLLVVLD